MEDSPSRPSNVTRSSNVTTLRSVTSISVRSIEARPTTGADQVAARLRVCEQTGRIRGVNISWRESMLAESGYRAIEAVKLCASEVALLFIVGRSQMRHQAVNANMFEPPQRIAELRNVFGAHTQ